VNRHDPQGDGVAGLPPRRPYQRNLPLSETPMIRGSLNTAAM
jgi:hypothetical protein